VLAQLAGATLACAFLLAVFGDKGRLGATGGIGFRHPQFSAQDGEGAGATAWQPPLIQLAEWPPAGLDFKLYRGDVRRFLADTKLRPVSIGNKSFEAVPPAEEYTWEGSILDCSITDSATTLLPSTLIQQVAKLSFDMRGPSWLDASGAPMFTYYEESGNGSHALLVRATFLRDFLTAHQLELVVLYWFERMELNNQYGRKHPQVSATTSARLAADLKLHAGTPTRSEDDLD
jgi:hypothetical protein